MGAEDDRSAQAQLLWVVRRPDKLDLSFVHSPSLSSSYSLLTVNLPLDFAYYPSPLCPEGLENPGIGPVDVGVLKEGREIDHPSSTTAVFVIDDATDAVAGDNDVGEAEVAVYPVALGETDLQVLNKRSDPVPQFSRLKIMTGQ